VGYTALGHNSTLITCELKISKVTVFIEQYRINWKEAGIFNVMGKKYLLFCCYQLTVIVSYQTRTHLYNVLFSLYLRHFKFIPLVYAELSCFVLFSISFPLHFPELL
jgi:hypothetical protein